MQWWIDNLTNLLHLICPTFVPESKVKYRVCFCFYCSYEITLSCKHSAVSPLNPWPLLSVCPSLCFNLLLIKYPSSNQDKETRNKETSTSHKWKQWQIKLLFLSCCLYRCWNVVMIHFEVIYWGNLLISCGVIFSFFFQF